jgi:UDP-GlcNAc:undecaprenyl-phosphate/decaprenyl-phosphate GlcNAc-1-phosphate transferase
MILNTIYDWIFMLFVGAWLLPHTIQFLERHGRIDYNYEGTRIPSSLGIFIWMLLGIQALFLQAIKAVDSMLSNQLQDIEPSFDVFLVAATVVFVLGWLDDTIGLKAVKGFKGNWRHIREEKTISMGAVKALGTGAVSVWALAKCSPEGLSVWQMAVQLLLLMLMTNAMNLLDVRPGRACKAFLALAPIPIWLADNLEAVWLLMPIMIGSLLLFTGDVRGQLMLGDSGSNLLGFSLGIWFVLWAPLWLQLLMLAGALVTHYVAETGSITNTIERHKWLDWMDRLGRV